MPVQTLLSAGVLNSAGAVFVTHDSNPRQRVVQAVASMPGSGTLTSTGVAPSNLDTVTIDTKTYTFKTALTATDGEVLIGASAATALANLKSAINHAGTPGTDYVAAVAHPTVTAGTLTATTLVVTSLTAGAAGTTIATTKVAATLSWGAATLTGALTGTVDVAVSLDGGVNYASVATLTLSGSGSDSKAATITCEGCWVKATVTALTGTAAAVKTLVS